MPLSQGTLVARRYRIVRALGEGGAATTYRALDEVAGVEVALKVLRARTRSATETLEIEFGRLCGVTHPHLALVHDFGIDDGMPFYSSRLVEGTTLDRFAAARDFREVRLALDDALDALELLHEIGIAHGDFKPDNVLVDARGRGVLIDLGCARALDAPAAPQISGTPGYLAPELLRGERADARADLYAVGVTLQALCASASARGPRDAVVERTIARLTSASPEDRPTSVPEVREILGPADRRAPSWRRQPHALIGRQVEMHAFGEMLASLGSATPGRRALALHGPSGIGKSRLLREMKWAAQRECRVTEAVARPDARIVTSLLERACGDVEGSLGAGASAAVRARLILAEGDAPSVLVLDDVDTLDRAERVVLDALVRSLGPSDSVAVVLAGRAPPELAAETLHVVELAPLGAADVARWAGVPAGSDDARELERASGGVPAHLEALAPELVIGARDGAPRRPRRATAERSSVADLAAALDESSKDALADLVAAARSLASSEMDDAREAIGKLVAVGLARYDERGVRLACAADAATLARVLGSPRIERAHARLAERLARSEGPEERAYRARHLAEGGATERAASALFADAARWREAPVAWAQAAEALLARSRRTDVALAAAEIHEHCGRPERALQALAAALRARPAAEARERVRLAAAAAYLKLGEPRRALRACARLRHDDASVADVRSRAYLQHGAYSDAARTASAALAAAQSAGETAPATARLHEALGIASTYLGELDRARHHLAQAARLHAKHGDDSARVRVTSYEGILELRAGRVREAARAHGEALALAEAKGIADHIATAALNLGTAMQQTGDWGAALGAYERALEMGVALGKTGTEIAARFNLANLYAEIGSFERAVALAEIVARAAERARLGYFSAAAIALRGEIAMMLGDSAEAAELLGRARGQFQALGAERETVEIDLRIAEASLERGEVEQARALVHRTQPGALDLSVRAEAFRALIERDAARLDAAIERAREAGLLALEAELVTRQSALDRTRPSAALSLWERIAATLAPTLHDTFWRHPRRAALRAPASAGTNAETNAAALRRLLDLNKRLNSALSTDRILEHALDAAIDLTGAERGFIVLVAEDGHEPAKLEVAAARNIDRERVGRSHLKFSHTIAERAIVSDAPVVTTDALADERFMRQRSVHAMRLKSVVAVPIRSPGGVMGALYLDNRFQPSGFDRSAVDTLVALSDQIAIALVNARLRAALEQRTRDLEAQKERVEELARAQAGEIERLSGEVRAHQEAFTQRYDYARIAGRSAPMRRVLAVLDRVTDSTASVLVEGESGTGKELVARALHANGPRRKARFVSINCAAIPETLLEAELFGYTRGAFTGADRDREGLFVAARGGTVFLDELGDMPLSMQAKLLRVLQERELRPLGARDAVSIDVRLVCATNRDLEQEVRAGRFRQDLFYRVAVVRVALPPLRERLEDLPAVAATVLARLAEDAGGTPLHLTRAALRALAGHPWPGNVRELENVLTRATLLSEGAEIDATHLDLARPAPLERAAAPARDRSEFERDEAARILEALSATRWNMSETARALGMARNTLYRKLSRYRIARTS